MKPEQESAKSTVNVKHLEELEVRYRQLGSKEKRLWDGIDKEFDKHCSNAEKLAVEFSSPASSIELLDARCQETVDRYTRFFSIVYFLYANEDGNLAKIQVEALYKKKLAPEERVIFSKICCDYLEKSPMNDSQIIEMLFSFVESREVDGNSGPQLKLQLLPQAIRRSLNAELTQLSGGHSSKSKSITDDFKELLKGFVAL